MLPILSLFGACSTPPKDEYRGRPEVPRWTEVRKSTSVVNGQLTVAPSRKVAFDTDEGTFMSVDVSPDGTALAFDLLGDLYWLPIEGGQAIALTTGRSWDQAPRFSPDGKFVYFVSDRKGYKNIWRLGLPDRSLRQVTHSDSDIMGTPNWSQDGDHLVASLTDAGTRNTEFVLQSIDPVTGNMTAIDAPSGPWVDMDTFESLRPWIRIFSAVESADGDVFFSQAQFDHKRGRSIVRIDKFDLNTQTRTVITAPDDRYNEFKPQLSHDGNLLAYFRQYHDRRTEVRILNRTTGQDEALIELSNADDASYYAVEDTRPNYAFTPDDGHLVFWHGGKIHRVNLTDGSSEIVPFRATVEHEVWVRAQPAVQHVSENGEATIVRWPSMSLDGQTMAFAAIGYVWLMDLKTGVARRLTDSNDFEYMPALSPDGKSVAYVGFDHSGNNYGSGRLMVVDVDGGSPRELLAGPGETYLVPKWSPDGSMIALIRELDGEQGIEGAFGWTPVVNGIFQDVAPAPTSSERSSLYIFARFVGFDETGEKLLFSHPMSKTETVLTTTYLDGSGSQTLAVSDVGVGGIVPSPDLMRVALTMHDGTVWVVPFSAGSRKGQVSTSSADAFRVSAGGGYYVAWNGSEQLTYGFGQNVYRYRLGRSGPEVRPVTVPFAKPMATRPIAFTGARLITLSGRDGAEPVIESGAVVLSGQRITAVGRIGELEIPSDAVVVDVTGKTIVPGFFDTHYHRIGGNNLSALALPVASFGDHSAIAYGVTTAWEPGASPNDGVPATVDLQQAGRILGPRWSHSAMGAVGWPWEQLTTYVEAFAAVEQHRGLGVAVLKEYNTPTRGQRQWLSVAARENGLGIVAHIQSFDGMMTRVVDGYTGGDHPYIPVPFFKDVHELLRQTGYIWTPNIVITPGTVGTNRDQRGYYCRAISEWKSQMNYGAEEHKSICDPDQEKATVPYDIHRVGRVAKQVALAARNGVHIGVSAHNMPGSNLHREMWYLWKGGMPIEDVLRAATIGNAEKLGLQEEIGSLEPGKMADFLVLDENPLDDILNTLSLKYTVQGGVVYDSATAQRADLRSLRE